MCLCVYRDPGKASVSSSSTLFHILSDVVSFTHSLCRPIALNVFGQVGNHQVPGIYYRYILGPIYLVMQTMGSRLGTHDCTISILNSPSHLFRPL